MSSFVRAAKSTIGVFISLVVVDNKRLIVFVCSADSMARVMFLVQCFCRCMAVVEIPGQWAHEGWMLSYEVDPKVRRIATRIQYYAITCHAIPHCAISSHVSMLYYTTIT
jgi:hypothetical protein